MAARLKLIVRLPHQHIKIVSFRNQVGSVSTRCRSTTTFDSQHSIVTKSITWNLTNLRRYSVFKFDSAGEAEMFLEQCLEQKNVDQAFGVLDTLKRGRIQPTLGVYRAIIKVCQAAKQSKRAMELLRGIEQSPDSDRSSFEILLCVAEGTHNEVLGQQLLQAIQKGIKQFEVRIHDLTQLAKCFENNSQKTMEIFDYATNELKYDIDTAFILQIIKNCAVTKSLNNAVFVHHSIPKDILSDHAVSNSLLEMYSRCTTFENAFQIFESMRKDIVTWNIMLGECRYHKKYDIALDLFERMLQSKRIQPNERTMVHVIGICADSGSGDLSQKLISIIQAYRIGLNPEILTSLINMFGKTGNVEMALNCFKRIKEELDVVAWSALMNAYIDNNKPQEALKIFEEMKKSGIQPDKVTCGILLKVCIATGAVESGKKIHAFIKKQRMAISPELEEQLIRLYAKENGMESALQQVGVPKHAAGWNAILKECRDNNDLEAAIKALQQMTDLGMKPDEYTYSILLGICKNTKHGELGQKVHQLILDSDLPMNAAVNGSLVAMYAKCGMVREAMAVMEKFPDRDIMAYNNLFLACRDGFPFQAVDLYKKMMEDKIKPDEWTMTHMLKICGYYRLLDFIPVIENDIKRFHLDQFPSVQKSIASMRDLLTTRGQKVQSFNQSLDNYRANGNTTAALDVFRKMTKSGVPPDARTFDILLQLLKDKPSDELLEEINLQMNQWRFNGDTRALVSFMVALKKDINQAIATFKDSKQKTSAMWSDVINALADKPDLLLDLYQTSSKEDRANIKPELYSTILTACGQYGTTDLLKSIHEDLVAREALQHNLSALIAASLKLGNKTYALETIRKQPKPDAAAYQAVVLAHKGDPKTCFQLFNEMLTKNVKPTTALLAELVGLAASLRNFQIGQQLQSAMARLGVKPDFNLGKELICLHAACGKLPVAVSLCREWNGTLIKPQNRGEVWEMMLRTCNRADLSELLELMSDEERGFVDVSKILLERKK